MLPRVRLLVDFPAAVHTFQHPLLCINAKVLSVLATEEGYSTRLMYQSYTQVKYPFMALTLYCEEQGCGIISQLLYTHSGAHLNA